MVRFQLPPPSSREKRKEEKESPFCGAGNHESNFRLALIQIKIDGYRSPTISRRKKMPEFCRL